MFSCCIRQMHIAFFVLFFLCGFYCVWITMNLLTRHVYTKQNKKDFRFRLQFFFSFFYFNLSWRVCRKMTQNNCRKFAISRRFVFNSSRAMNSISHFYLSHSDQVMTKLKASTVMRCMHWKVQWLLLSIMLNSRY